MRMSRKATSGWCSAIASTALPPSSQEAMIDSSGQASRSRDSSALRRISSSSAMSQVGAFATASVDMVVPPAGAGGQRDGGGHAAGEVGGDGEAGGVAVGQAQALAHVLQADAGAAALGVEAAPVVGDGDRDLLVAGRGADPHRAAAGLGLEPVLDRVLDQG